jgi:hypothetical protein
MAEAQALKELGGVEFVIPDTQSAYQVNVGRIVVVTHE